MVLLLAAAYQLYLVTRTEENNDNDNQHADQQQQAALLNNNWYHHASTPTEHLQQLLQVSGVAGGCISVENCQQLAFETTNSRSSSSASSVMTQSDNSQLHAGRRRRREETSGVASVGSTALEAVDKPAPCPETPMNTASDNNTTDDSLAYRIRQEWINAVFGPDFFPASITIEHDNQTNNNYRPPRQGMGLAQIPHYVTYHASIPPPPHSAYQGMPLEQAHEPKLGMTLSKLPLGLYVHAVEPASEAALAGVRPHSILVSINQAMGMLVEPTQQALERWWQYEGLFGDYYQDDTGSAASPSLQQQPWEGASDDNKRQPSQPSQSQLPQRPSVREPMALTLIKDGQLYTVVLLSNPPYGIQWASCGNFCLVNRSYSYASSIGGVRRGSLVASVNGRSLREMDHTATGTLLRDLFQAREETIDLWLCFTPAAGRTGFFERKQQGAEGSGETSAATAKTKIACPSPPKKGFTQSTRDGVEIRVHSLEETLNHFLGLRDNGPCGGSNWNSPTSSTKRRKNKNSEGADDWAGSVAELARRVVAGEVLAPLISRRRSRGNRNNYHWSRQQRVFAPCPTLPREVLLYLWDPVQALVFCLQSQRELLMPAPADPRRSSNDDMNGDTLILLKALATDDMIQVFLLQFISLICDTPQNTPESVATPQATTKGYDWSMEEKKEDVGFSLLPLTAGAPTTTSLLCLSRPMDHKMHAEIVSGTLLKLARKDQDFCQRLYFCLRSYICTLDDQDPDSSSTSSTPSSLASRGTSPHQNLLALFNCLKLLRSAEREAVATWGDGSCALSVEQQPPPNLVVAPDSAPQHQTVNASSNRSVNGASELSLSTTNSERICKNQCVAPDEHPAHKPAFSYHKSERKGMFGFFRKKKKSSERLLSDIGSVSEPKPNEDIVPPPESSLSPAAPTRHHHGRQLSRRRISKGFPHHSSQTEAQPAVFINASTPFFENMSEFVRDLDQICGSIEKKLLKSFSQKITDWALQPWSASKSTVLASLTDGMRTSLAKPRIVRPGEVAEFSLPFTSAKSLRRGAHHHAMPPTSDQAGPFCLVNPLNSQELLVGVDQQECYILPSAHFPLLLTFDAIDRQAAHHMLINDVSFSYPPPPMPACRGDQSYRIRVEISNFASSSAKLVIHGAISGVIKASFSSTSKAAANIHVFRQKLTFDTRSAYGAPRTLSLRLSGIDDDDALEGQEAGFGWIDLVPIWERLERFQEKDSFCTAKIYNLADYSFDEHGRLISVGENLCRSIRLECKVTAEIVDEEPANPMRTHKRMLLYKHDDDLRQEAFAIQFIKVCDTILKSSGLDLKLLTFGCIPVGSQRGFIEWVEGSVPLSDICQAFSSVFGGPSPVNGDEENNDNDTDYDGDGDTDDDISMIAKAGMSNYESLYRMGIESMGNAASAMNKAKSTVGPKGSMANNPIQDFLRSIAFDADAPYFVRHDVMDTYIKSCAGYCVITYLLGVGDRHLDNLLLHNHTGSFFHCDYSFIFGADPKKYLPMRVTEDMIHGMGGRDGDNYAKFLSMTGSAFLTMRRPENVRFLLSLVRVMEASRLPNISARESGSGSAVGTAEVLFGMRQRLLLDMSEEQALAFMEEMIENSISSKLWMAVDAIHSLGKRF